jgi:hypothetical protein
VLGLWSTVSSIKLNSSELNFFKPPSLFWKDWFAGVAGLDPKFLQRDLILGVRWVLASYIVFPKVEAWLEELFLFVGVDLKVIFSFFTTGTLSNYFCNIFLRM